MKNKLIVLGVLLGMFFSISANEAPAVNKRVIGILEQQVALQAIIKDFMMIGADVDAEAARNDLDEQVAFLEESYLDYMDYAGMDEEVMKIFEKGSEDWMRLRMLVVDEVTKENASKLVKTNTQLLFILNTLLEQEKSNKDYVGSVEIEKAFQMRIYLDRISAYYYAYMWGIDREISVRSMAGAQMYFENLKTQLQNSNLNSAKINGKFTNIDNQWSRYKKYSTQPTTRKSVVIEFSNVYQDLVSDLKSVTSMYKEVEETYMSDHKKKKTNQDS